MVKSFHCVVKLTSCWCNIWPHVYPEKYHFKYRDMRIVLNSCTKYIWLNLKLLRMIQSYAYYFVNKWLNMLGECVLSCFIKMQRLLLTHSPSNIWNQQLKSILENFTQTLHLNLALLTCWTSKMILHKHTAVRVNWWFIFVLFFSVMTCCQPVSPDVFSYIASSRAFFLTNNAGVPSFCPYSEV